MPPDLQIEPLSELAHRPEEFDAPDSSGASASVSESSAGDALVSLEDARGTLLDPDLYKALFAELGWGARQEVARLVQIALGGKPSESMEAMDKIRDRLIDNLRLTGRIKTVSRKASIQSPTTGVAASARTIAILQAGRRSAELALALTDNPDSVQFIPKGKPDALSAADPLSGTVQENSPPVTGRRHPEPRLESQPLLGRSAHPPTAAPVGRAGGSPPGTRHPTGAGTDSPAPDRADESLRGGVQVSRSTPTLRSKRGFVSIKQKLDAIRATRHTAHPGPQGFDSLFHVGEREDIDPIELVAAAVDPILLNDHPAPIPLSESAPDHPCNSGEPILEWSNNLNEPEDPDAAEDSGEDEVEDDIEQSAEGSDVEVTAASEITAGHRPPEGRHALPGLCARIRTTRAGIRPK